MAKASSVSGLSPTQRIMAETQLASLQLLQKETETRIQELRDQLGGARGSFQLNAGLSPMTRQTDTLPMPKGKRVMSAAARSRIAAAQRARWADHNRQKAEAAKKAKTIKIKRLGGRSASIKAGASSAPLRAPAPDLSVDLGDLSI